METWAEDQTLPEESNPVVDIDNNTHSEGLDASNESPYPIRPGARDCDYFMKTGTCAYGRDCKFNHPSTRESYVCPPDILALRSRGRVSARPRVPPYTGPLNTQSHQAPYIPGTHPGEIVCNFFMRTSSCRFGEGCRFNHPYDVETAHRIQNAAGNAQYPERLNVSPCTFYMRTGRCNYGMSCKFNHPSYRSAVASTDFRSSEVSASPVVAPGGYYSQQAYSQPSYSTQVAATPAPSPYGGDFQRYPSPHASSPQYGSPYPGSPQYSHHPAHANFGRAPVIPRAPAAAVYPRRGGAPPCSYFLRTGMCSYGSGCKFDHPPRLNLPGGDASRDNHLPVDSPRGHSRGGVIAPYSATQPNAIGQYYDLSSHVL